MYNHDIKEMSTSVRKGPEENTVTFQMRTTELFCEDNETTTTARAKE